MWNIFISLCMPDDLDPENDVSFDNQIFPLMNNFGATTTQ